MCIGFDRCLNRIIENIWGEQSILDAISEYYDPISGWVYSNLPKDVADKVDEYEEKYEDDDEIGKTYLRSIPALLIHYVYDDEFSVQTVNEAIEYVNKHNRIYEKGVIYV